MMEKGAATWESGAEAMADAILFCSPMGVRELCTGVFCSPRGVRELCTGVVGADTFLMGVFMGVMSWVGVNPKAQNGLSIHGAHCCKDIACCLAGPITGQLQVECEWK